MGFHILIYINTRVHGHNSAICVLDLWPKHIAQLANIALLATHIVHFCFTFYLLSHYTPPDRSHFLDLHLSISNGFQI